MFNSLQTQKGLELVEFFDEIFSAKSNEAKGTQELPFEAHAKTYEGIKIIIQKDIITDHKAFPLLVLREKYICELKQQNEPSKKFTPRN